MKRDLLGYRLDPLGVAMTQRLEDLDAICGGLQLRIKEVEPFVCRTDVLVQCEEDGPRGDAGGTGREDEVGGGGQGVE